MPVTTIFPFVPSECLTPKLSWKNKRKKEKATKRCAQETNELYAESTGMADDISQCMTSEASKPGEAPELKTL